MAQGDLTPFRYAEFNNGLHWRLKAVGTGRVFDYWPTTGRWRALVGRENGWGVENLWQLLTGEEWDFGDPADYTPTAICEDCGAHAVRNEPLAHAANCVPGESKKWEQHYSEEEPPW